MKLFAKGFALTAIVVASVLWLLPPEIPKDVRTGYMAAMIDKHHRLDSLPTPRIIITGGSNVAFGINSERLQDSLKMPVVNLALAAGVGMPFILHEVEHVVRPGDIIILSTEYYMGEDQDARTMETVRELVPESKAYTPEPSLYDRTMATIGRAVQRLQGAVRSRVAGEKIITRLNEQPLTGEELIYLRSIFSPFGDVLLRPGQRSKKISHIHFEPTRYAKYIGMMNDLDMIVRARGASVYYIYPAYMYSDYISSKNGVEAYEQQLTSQLTMPILGTPREFVFADSLFFNTAYHLTREGREVRTTLVIDKLKNFLKK